MRFLKVFQNLFVVAIVCMAAWLFYAWGLQTPNNSQQTQSAPPSQIDGNLRHALKQNEVQSTEHASQIPTSPEPAGGLRSLASLVGAFWELPTESDKEWVLENATNSLKAGLVSQSQLATHISELSSIRMFTVMDRTSPYSDSESDGDLNQKNEEDL